VFDVVGIGTNSVDDVLQLSVLMPELLASGKARIAERHMVPGGQTATMIAACAALGLRSRYVGAYGCDDNGKRVRAALGGRHVDLSLAVECQAPNRSAVIVLDANGRRTVLWQRADGLKLTADRLDRGFLDARVVHIDDDDPDLALDIARMARDAGRVVTSDIEHPSETVEELISTVTFPILEQHLPPRLTGETDPERALRKLRRLNPGVLCVTLAEQGAVALEGNRFYASPAFPVQVVDNTGAGDVFRAGFVYGLLQKWEIPEILRFANAAAAVSCTRLGAIPSVPSLPEVTECWRR
jgi:sugar/nucleoside kinase (ribokinase family)